MKKSILFLLGSLSLCALGAPAPIAHSASNAVTNELSWGPYLLHKTKLYAWDIPKHYTRAAWRKAKPARHKAADLSRSAWRGGKKYGYKVTVAPTKWVYKKGKAGAKGAWHMVAGESKEIEKDL